MDNLTNCITSSYTTPNIFIHYLHTIHNVLHKDRP